MAFTTIKFKTPDLRVQELLLAELYEMPGITGFEETDEELIAYGDSNLIEWEDIRKIAQQHGLHFESEQLEEKNWNEEWERNFSPVQVDDFCYIRADFHPENSTDQHEIIITPKMSFGTGHHATTQMMINLMRNINFEGKKVFDFGTGTGILAILAELLGASTIFAVDYDIWSYENALENCSRNHTKKIQLMQGTIEDVKDTGFDIILANINRNILLQYMSSMAEMLAPNGILLLSGILGGEDEPAILHAATDQGLNLVQVITKDKWAAIQFQK
jgi:ribosomal protein L11 methyltransferase